MDISPLAIVNAVIFNLPLVIKTVVLALLSRSPNASVQDVITEVIVVTARPMLSTPAAILKSQIRSQIDWGVWGPIWIAKYAIPRPQDDCHDNERVYGVRNALVKAIKELGTDDNAFDLPEIVDVQAEWTGYRSGVSTIARRLDIPECKQYEMMMKEVAPNSPTILYFHGGAFCLMDPVTHRPATSALAQQTGGRCFSVRYRLAPQDPFPSALLDAFIAYLSLISPPPGSFHEPISAKNIIFSGDSSGAGLATSLLLLLTTLNRMGIGHIRFHGVNVPIDATEVAGLAITSPWLDISRSLPSVLRNIQYDIIAPPSSDYTMPHPRFPHDSVWPARSPRVETYCESSMVTHPLVSPLAAKREYWRGVAPVYVSVGWESMQDEAEVFTRRLHEAGGTVIFDGYVGMPHCFALMPWNQAGRTAFENCANFCVAAVQGKVKSNDFGSWTDKDGIVETVELGKLGMRNNERKIDLDDVLVNKLLEKQRRWRVDLERKLRNCEKGETIKINSIRNGK
ncbi:hypothetical protein BOTNAR_0057g00320 [Botryotinia narcissicola]|uniref:Alpha/beta hydrolase fold-3 domain-containing protein n=1 Tax=Botryotinia narcissicola TaxID=278944 RepID=A0A4Z1IYY9_9HELO|nr:hypothetical protein BOTNAR_0057g00320 [Botryotinia narcissicola]